MTTKFSISIVICTCNRPVLLERCLGALAILHHPASQVLVVDNAPDSPATRLLAERFKTGYQLAPVRGLSRARNIGLQSCTSDIIAYLDDDMIPHADWLAELSAPFADPAVMAVTGPMLPSVLATVTAAALVTGLQISVLGSAPFHVDQHSRDWFARANFGGLGDGNFAVRRSVLNTWDGFEESIGRGMLLNSGEDHYAFFSIIAAGHRITYNPRAIVFHPPVELTPEHRLHALTLNVAYTCLLLRQHPRYIFHMLQFAIEGMCGKKRWWRSSNPAPPLQAPSWRQRFRALCKGLQLFWSTQSADLAPHSGG